jgi:hypothetical protein
MGIVILASFVVVLSPSGLAEVLNPRTLATILSLSDIVIGTTNDLNDVADSISADLLYKQKFWSLRNDTLVDVIDIELLGICEDPETGELLVDNAACAFNMESLQLGPGSSGNITAIGSTGANVFTDTNDVLTNFIDANVAPTNFLVEWGIGKFGCITAFPGVCEVAIFCDFNDPCNGPLELNGEKPQGMTLIPFYITLDQQIGGLSVGGTFTAVSSVDEIPVLLEQKAGETGREVGIKIAENLCSNFPSLEGCS